MPHDNKKVREFTQGNQSSKQGKDANVAKKEVDEQRKIIADQAKLLENFQKTLESMEAMKVHVHVDTPRPSHYNGNRTQQWSQMPLSCYHCGQPGHITGNCPLAGEHNKEVTINSQQDHSQSNQSAAAFVCGGYLYSVQRKWRNGENNH